MRIALFCATFPTASETFIINHVVRLVEAGHDVTILCHELGQAWDNVPSSMRDEIRTACRPVSRSLLRGRRQLLKALPSPDAARLLLGRLGAARPPMFGSHDVILAHFGPAGSNALTLRDRGLIEGPIATVFHGWEMSIRDAIGNLLPSYAKLFRKSEALLPISQFWSERLRQWGARPEKIRVLHMGADLPAVPADIARPLHEPLRVLQVGRLVDKKGARYAIEAVRLCRAPVTLDIIGAGPQDEELRAIEARTPGTNRITFRGRVPHDDVLAALDETDVFLLPSVTADNGDMEGIPVALMEAMLHGRVVVSTVHSGIPELISHGVSGILVPEHSAQAIAEVLDAIAAGRYDLEEMRRRAVQTVTEQFNNDALFDTLVDILTRVAAGRGLNG